MNRFSIMRVAILVQFEVVCVLERNGLTIEELLE